MMEQILQKVRAFRECWQGLSFFGQILPLMLTIMLFVALGFHIYFEVSGTACEAVPIEIKYLATIECERDSFFLKQLIDVISSGDTRNLGLLLAASISWFFFHWRARSADQDAKTSKQGLTVEQITRAIEQLSHKKLFVRVGGIRGLEKISDNHEEERSEIAYILVTFIRKQATRKPDETELEREEEFHTHREKRLDIEIAVNALARITSKLKKQEQFPRDKDKKYYLFNLENLDLRGLRFEDADLSEFNLGGSDFSGAWLRRTNFTGALLFKSSRMNISGVAKFFRAYLDHANFTNAFLNGTVFIWADLSSAKFDNTTLQAVNLDGALVSDTNFEHSNHLTQEQINKAYYFGSPPHLPDGLELPPEEPYYRPQHIS